MMCPICRQLMAYIETIDGGDETKEIWVCNEGTYKYSGEPCKRPIVHIILRKVA